MLTPYTVCTAILASSVVSTIFTDEILRKHYLSVLYICACFFFACCIITLSRYCKLRSKTKSNSDLESDEVTHEAASYFSYRKSFTVLCKRRPIYGMVVFTCVVFSISYLLLIRVFDVEEDWVIGSDPWVAGTLLLSSALYLLPVMFVVVTHEESELKSTSFSYEPFDEKIKIPMNVYVPKIVAVLMTGQFNIFGNLLIQFIAVILLAIVCDLPEQNITDIMHGSKVDHTILICMMVCGNFVVLLTLIGKIAEAHETTKNLFLGTFEKNWQRNLKAYEFLLPEIKANSLDDLRLVLLKKIEAPQLKKEDVKVIDYIMKPLWKTKRAFVDTPEDVYRANSRYPRSQNYLPDSAEVQTSPTPQNHAALSNGTPSSPEMSPPMTRSKAKRLITSQNM